MQLRLQLIWVIVKIMVPFWVLILYCRTQYVGYPKRGHNFDNFGLTGVCRFRIELLGVQFKGLAGSWIETSFFAARSAVQFPY